MKDLTFYGLIFTFTVLVLININLFIKNKSLIEINKMNKQHITELRNHLATLGNCYSKEYRPAL